MTDTKKYYVYKLVDPRNNKPFYIGKGSGKRVTQHEKEAKLGYIHPKCDIINAIIKDKLEVVREIVQYFELEADAYAYEKQLIKEIGLKNLTNLVPGGVLPSYARLNKGIRNDVELVKLIAQFIKKVESHNYFVFRLGTFETEIPKSKLESMIKIWCDKLKPRGNDWILSEFKKHNVIINIVSKVENSYGH